jgi:heterodisulfide reductase subunit C
MTQGPNNVIRLGRVSTPDLEEIVELVSSCIQCGTCSGSCPTAPAMDFTPRQIMHMIQSRMQDEVLRAQAPWLCATCFSCTVRCPRGIPVADVLARLRGLAITLGYAETAGMTFTKAFLDIVRRYGRMFEPELILRYHARQQPLGLLGAAPVGLAMLRKGKIAPLPERLAPAEGGDEVRRIFERVQARQHQAG